MTITISQSSQEKCFLTNNLLDHRLSFISCPFIFSWPRTNLPPKISKAGRKILFLLFPSEKYNCRIPNSFRSFSRNTQKNIHYGDATGYVSLRQSMQEVLSCASCLKGCKRNSWLFWILFTKPNRRENSLLFTNEVRFTKNEIFSDHSLQTPFITQWWFKKSFGRKE